MWQKRVLRRSRQSPGKSIENKRDARDPEGFLPVEPADERDERSGVRAVG